MALPLGTGEPMASIWAGDRQRRFYLLLGATGLVAIAIGFSTTYVIPMAERRLHVPPIVHLHGLAALMWVLLLVVQASLVRSAQTGLHMIMGRGALPLAIFIWFSGIFTGIWAARRDIPSQGLTASASLLGTVTGLSIFLTLAIAAVWQRRRPDWHKRLIGLATIALLWPAFFRWRHLMPMVPRPEIVFALLLADAPILVAALRDKVRYGRIHPVWLYGGPALFIEQATETFLFESGSLAWRQLGRWLFALLS